MVLVKGVLTTDLLLKKVAKTIEEHRLFSAGDTVVVAVSGGADSSALLDILASLTCLRLTLVVAHLNHCLRSQDSEADETFVRNLADRYGVPVEVRRVDVRTVSLQKKISLEEAGRLARYEWFDSVAETYAAQSIVLGHHADDQAETFLLRLLRGAGATGLAGMRPLSAGRYVRPLLYVTRAEIVAYLEDRGLEYCNDSSNEDTVFLRNRIRHECLPFLATFNPAIAPRLAVTSEILAADEAVLEAATDRLFACHASNDNDEVLIRLAAVHDELPGLRYRLYRRAVKVLKGDLGRISAAHLQLIDSLVSSSRSTGELSLPGGVFVAKRYEHLAVYKRGSQKFPEHWEITILGPGRYQLPSGSSIEICLQAPPVDWTSLSPLTAYFDLGKTPFPWTLRTFRSGDRFCPLGMSGTKKVKDYFIDCKVPVHVRRKTALLFSGNELIWVCGFRVAEAGRILPSARETVRVVIPEITT